MSYNGYNDAPGKIKTEGQSITLTLTKTGPTTAQVCWNIPTTGTSSCDDTNLAYNGIVIVANLVENTPSDRPKDESTYIPDPTVDSNLHAGDKIGSALVVGAFYDDRETTCLNVTDLEPNQAYFFTAHAVDKQYRYHQEGVHAYSQTLGGDEREALPGYQVIQIGFQDTTDLLDQIKTGTASGVQLSAPTCLEEDTEYYFHIKTTACLNDCDEAKCDDCEPIQIIINGSDAQTYGDLVNAINAQMVNLCDHPTLPTPPNVNCLYMDGDSCTLQKWNGSSYEQLPVICHPTDPNIVFTGQYWLNTNNGELSQYNGVSWDLLTYIKYFKDPTNLTPTDFWFNGTQGYQWGGDAWCENTTYVQTNDPAITETPSAGSYWFNPEEGIMYGWSTSCNKWVATEVIVAPIDPNNDTNGTFWFDVDDSILYIRDTGVWVEYDKRVEVTTEEPELPSAEMAWVNPETDQIFIRNTFNSGWDETPGIFFHMDPLARTSCQLWWDTSTDVLNVWDIVNQVWVEVTSFIESIIDPALPVILEPGTLWYNPTTEVMVYWDGSEWTDITVIYHPTDPVNPTIDEVWNDTANDKFFKWTGTEWTEIEVFRWIEAPGSITPPTYWFDTTNGTSLAMWNGIGRVGIVYQTTPCEPEEGFTYYNSTDEIVYEWKMGAWRPVEMPVMVSLNCQGNMVFTTSIVGSCAFVEVINGDLFNNLCEEVYINNPEVGKDNIPGVQNYAVMGVGTDGTTDERRNLVTELRHQLGAPAYNVELTNEQFDTCIRLALEELRRRSASAYKRGFFFLPLKPGEQVYELSDRSKDFHKITEVMAAYRIQSSFLGNATGQGAYGQAMLQHLYQMGSFDLVSYHIVSDYVELMNELFAAYLVFNWDEDQKKLHFYQTFGSNEKVLLDVMTERTEQELMRDRFCKTWIERYALGKAQLMLAEIRGRYATLPGAGGGISLNAQDMKISGEANLEWCEEELLNYISNEIETVGMGGDFLLG